MLISPNNHNNDIESPLTIFNNIINNISQSFEEILFNKLDKKNPMLSKNNLIIFNEKSIIILNYIKLYIHNNEMSMKIVKNNLDISDLQHINSIYVNWDKINKLYFNYILMYNTIANGYDEIPISFIQNINNLLIHKKLTEDDYFLIPYKNKISKIYDNKKYLENIYNRYNYIIKFKQENKNTFSYKIYSILSSEIQETIGLECLRFLDSDILLSGTFERSQSVNFLTNLFNYGEITK